MTAVTYQLCANAQPLRVPVMTANGVFTAVCAAFESLGKVVALLDEEMRIVQASPALRGLLSTPQPEGRLIADFMACDGLAQCLRSGKRCDLTVTTAGGRDLAASGAVLADGSLNPAARYIVCFDLDEGPGGGAADEAQRILRALEANRWRRSAAARALGISRATLWRRMRELGI